MERSLLLAALLLPGAALIGCAHHDRSAQATTARQDWNASLNVDARAEDDEDGDDDNEVEIPLSEVPEHVKAAALAAVPGIILEEAERETEDGRVVYGLEGEVDGREYEVEVSADGTVLEIEADDEDDDD